MSRSIKEDMPVVAVGIVPLAGFAVIGGGLMYWAENRHDDRYGVAAAAFRTAIVALVAQLVWILLYAVMTA